MHKPKDNQSRNWGVACHLIALIAYIGIPFGNLLGPLILWLVFRKEDPFIDEQGKESLNFQISMSIYLIISGILTVLVIGFMMLVILVVANFVMIIIAAIKINKDEEYRYPWTLRFIK